MKIKNLNCVMRIGINTRFLLKDRLEGIGIYTQEVSKRLVNMHPEHEWYFFFDRAYDQEFVFNDSVRPIVTSPPARHPFLWYWWFEKSLPRALCQNKIDLFFSPDSYLSLSTDIPQVLTVHDLAFEHYPQTIPWLVNQYYRYYFPRFCDKANQIISISEHTQKDLTQLYQTDPKKIHIIPNGVSEDFLPLKDEKRSSVLNSVSKGRPYFIYVGAVHPRKNVISLLKAFESFKYEHPALSHILIIVGRKAWDNEELNTYHQKMNYRHDVIWMENVARPVLIDLLGAATALVYVSLYEGFGLPVLEAMACGTPSITSKDSPMEEIAQNSALMVIPTSVEDIKNAMYQLATDEQLVMRLREKGLAYSRDYHWDQTAKLTSELIFSTLHNKKNISNH